MESLKIFDDFKFSDLNEDWIQSIWDTEFMIYNEPPDEYLMFLESEDMRLLLHETCTIVKSWLAVGKDRNDTEQCSEISWNTLIIMDIKVRALLAVLGYIINSGQGIEADDDSKQSCLYATNLYFILLTIPGSNAFNVFHPNLYQRSIETLRKNSSYLQPLVKKRTKPVSLDDFNITNESINDNVILLPNEKETLRKNLSIIVCSLTTMIKSFWFKDHVQSLDITIHGLLEVTKVESDCTDINCFNRQNGTVEVSLVRNAYAALQELCDSKHGSTKVTITIIAKYVLPHLLCNTMDTHTKFITNVRERTINFLKVLLHDHIRDAKVAIITLIQHLMLNCPDRLEARQRQASVLIKIFGICNESIILEAFKNVILLSHHNKIPYRIFAQEIIGKLLIDPFLMDYNISDNLKQTTRRVLLAVTLSRCMDCSSMVRGKAMAIIAGFTEFNIEMDKVIFKTIFEGSEPDKKFLTFKDIKEALSENTDLLPGSNTLLSMLIEQIEDERAMIRRSTLQIFKNLILLFPTLMNEVVPAISRRCRDPTLTVRRYAVQVLSQLLEKFPDNSQLLDEWVQTVIPQIFDIEIKVQEKVLDYLQELLLNRIISPKSANTVADSLPWKILNTLTNLKMRRHLSKACNLWVKNGTITNSVIKNMQAHIGTTNNIGAWIFLAALAENIQLPNMSKYITNYKGIFEENNFYTSLVLQVLKYSWKSLDNKVLEDLYLYLYQCLQQFKINFGLISSCLDIIHNIVQFLNPDKGNNLLKSNVQNLIKLSEAEITKIFKNETQAIEAAPHYLKAMFTLGYSTLLCPCKISPLTLRILQGILLEWEALPEVIKEIQELQASAVVILGQQAMRDREIAKEVVPIFGKLMRQETNFSSVFQIALKINTAKAMGDICVRFTALVEPYLSDMCVSMKDSSPQVREAIMVIFIQLLLEDYIKIKGPFFFHILTMLSDSDNMIRELTTFLIEERLLIKNKTLISQQFLQSIYHYNNYKSQLKIYNQRMREKERNALTLPGKKNEDKRRTIYDFMLDHLDPPGKIKLLVKITSQILGGTCVNSIDVKKEEGAYVLKDALYVISNERLRPSSLNKQNDDDQPESEESVVQQITPAASAITVIVEAMKKHGLEVLLPVLMKLRKKLSSLKSPLENEVKRLLVKTYSEYNKDQLSNISNEYPSLEKEVDQFKKQLGEIGCDNENSSEEGNIPCDTNNQITPSKISDIRSCNLHPTVLLERVSISQLSNVNSNSLDNWNPVTSTPISRQHSPSEPGPSTSTPRTSRCFEFELNNTTNHISKARKLDMQRKLIERNICQIQDDSESD